MPPSEMKNREEGRSLGLSPGHIVGTIRPRGIGIEKKRARSGSEIGRSQAGEGIDDD